MAQARMVTRQVVQEDNRLLTSLVDILNKTEVALASSDNGSLAQRCMARQRASLLEAIKVLTSV